MKEFIVVFAKPDNDHLLEQKTTILYRNEKIQETFCVATCMSVCHHVCNFKFVLVLVSDETP